MSSKIKQEKVKKLLKDSTLPDVYKQMIAGNLRVLSDKQLDRAARALAKEQLLLTRAGQAIKRFESARKQGWARLKKSQQKIADNFIAETIKKAAGSPGPKKKSKKKR